MGDENTPRNRKERRAAARNGQPTPAPSSSPHLDSKVPGIKYAQPDRSGPKGKTLFQLAEERSAELNKGKPFPKQSFTEESGEVVSWNDEAMGPAAEAVLWSFSLSMVHLMLDVLVNNQYRQEIVWTDIWSRFGTSLPVFWFMVYLFHTPTAKKLGVLKQIFFLATAVSAGCYMVYSGNTKGYYAVMKRAPPLGTVWIWAVVELELVYALVSVVGVGCYVWWNGYKAF
ncbi:hypothetical protein EJ05DRAFT_8388 [Pseudovirgaria hyperparasitica]|uniref:DUF7719 domain-containing protein n=1 Tax=Pseudovirgaria hyperparasitica TaxID=470096 RepID=A0A6A6WKG0_9PEZI|nr:uncharacterized protein EJ05DRAFT_8388 [Pseudovirgaria hyperparasitica]KAF2762647.1 hypothetical protein EJ05DRAFT_8388 [Pseudovirgaria hyperparasitica]